MTSINFAETISTLAEDEIISITPSTGIGLISGTVQHVGENYIVLEIATQEGWEKVIPFAHIVCLSRQKKA